MKFCSKCFQYNEIIQMIESNDNKGNCEIQDTHKNVFICDTEVDALLFEQIKRVLLDVVDLYTPVGKKIKKFPEDLKKTLWDALNDRWSIFNLNSYHIKSLLKKIFKDDSEFNQLMFEQKVVIPEENENYNNELIVQGDDWDLFVEDLKFYNRFHTDHLNLDNLKLFLVNAARTIIPEDYNLYRSRISNEKELSEDEMYGPPRGKSSPGRLNAPGIQLLYLATSEDTCIKEIRASFADHIYIGKFELLKDISVVDLTKFEESSLNSDNLLPYYFNRDSLIKIAEELSKPTNSSNSDIEYIPTQYISDYIKNIEDPEEKDTKMFDGILYNSTVHSGEFNLALFDEALVNCVSVNKREITSIDYEYAGKL